MNEAPSELVVIDKCYELVVWSCKHLAKFPKSYRFTLGNDLERRLYVTLEYLIRARYDSSNRIQLLQAINLELELLRFQFRLAKDLKCLSIESYGFAARSVDEVGRLVGGWLKSSRKDA